MKEHIITVCAVLTCLAGWSQSGRTGLILGMDSQGHPYYPLSSGNNDGFILAIGLMSFIITALYPLAARALRRKPKGLIAVYWLNAIFLALCVVLVELDSSLVRSAFYGDLVPWIGLGTAFAPALILFIMAVRNRFTRRAG